MKRTSHRSSGRKGWLSGIKRPSKKPTPLWQWIVGIPLMIVVAGGILLYVYAGYFRPQLGQRGPRLRTVRAEVIDRVESRLPDGQLDLAGSSLLARVDGQDLRLAARLPDWQDVRKGEIIEVDVASAGDGTLQAYSWKRLPAGSP